MTSQKTGWFLVPNRATALQSLHSTGMDYAHLAHTADGTYLECHTRSGYFEDAFILANQTGGFDVHGVNADVVRVYGPFPSETRGADTETAETILQATNKVLSRLAVSLMDRLEDGPVVSSERIGDVVDESGAPLYATTVRGMADLSDWLSSPSRDGKSGAAQIYDFKYVPMMIHLRHFPSRTNRRHMRVSDCTWTAELPSTPDGANVSQRKSIGAAFLTALCGKRGFVTEHPGHIAVAFHGSIAVILSDRRPSHVRPNMGRDHPGTMSLCLVLATYTDLPDVRETVSEMKLDADSAQLLSGSLRNEHGVPLSPLSPCLLLKSGADDLAQGRFGHEEWTGPADVPIKGLSTRQGVAVSLKAECRSTSEFPLTL